MTRLQCTRAAVGLSRLLHFSFTKSTAPKTQKFARAFHLAVAKNMASQLDISGIFPPIVTPFKDNEDIDYEKLKTNLAKWNKFSFAGYVVQGSNGEYVYLSAEEKIEVIEFVKKEIPKDRLIIAGSGCEGTRETIDLTKRMAAAGADAALVVTPCFFKNRMNAKAMNKHYTAIADVSPIPIILYNVPSNTGLEFPSESIVELSKHPNIIGLKDSGGNITNISGIIQETSGNNFQILAGSSGFLMPYLLLGAVGGVCALANVLGEEVCKLYDLCKDGKIEEARQLQLKLIKPNGAVTRKYNVPAMKYAMDLFGYYGGPCRSPLTSLLESEAADVEKSFNEFPRS